MSKEIKLQALDSVSELFPANFSIPWERSAYQVSDSCTVSTDGGLTQSAISSKSLAFWDDGSVKWTSHTINSAGSKTITVKKSSSSGSSDYVKKSFTTCSSGQILSITNQIGLKVDFYKSIKAVKSKSVIDSIMLNDFVVSKNISIDSTSSTKDNEYSFSDLDVSIDDSVVESETKEKLVVLTTGSLLSNNFKDSFINFKLRTYLYSDNDVVKFTFSIIYNLNVDERLGSLGLSLEKSLANAPLYDRHIKLSGANGTVMSESVQSITGLWHASSVSCRSKQAEGKKMPGPTDPEWDWDLSQISHVPAYNEYNLSQLSSNGFEISKRFDKGFSKVKISGGIRNDGCLFVGSPQDGGVSVGINKFWEKYPSGINVKGLKSQSDETSKISLWLYSPDAAPLDVSPYYDGLDQNTYESQLVGLSVTYEDYEPGFCDPRGISRSFELFLKPDLPSDEGIVSKADFAKFAAGVRNPPLYIADLSYTQSTGVLPFWKPSYKISNTEPKPREAEIEKNLALLFDYYVKQIDLHDWYGFWDYGDFQHTPDVYRHQWRYDVGGYAWDNSELSTDLWLWMYFLHSGDSKVFRIAEAMTKHTGEVDVYHLGRFQGFGTRHGVQHWSDSSKQLRISNVLFRRFYYYLSGGDERIGELMGELSNAQTAMLNLDSHRKVQAKDPNVPKGYALANIGLDWGSIIGSWMTNWERRGVDWESSKNKLINSITSLTNLKHGLAHNAVYMNVTTGKCIEVPPPTPEWAISHLTTVFGMNESITELIEVIKPVDFKLYSKLVKFWTDYAICFNGGPELQKEKYGFEFPTFNLSLKQSHARCTAHVSNLFGDAKAGKESWNQFFNTDGYSDQSNDWKFKELKPYDSLSGSSEEAVWNSTNITAQYGISAIYMLAKVDEYL